MTPAETWAARPALERADAMHRLVAELRARGDALRAAGEPGAVAIHQAARTLQGVEAAWRAALSQCCDRPGGTP